jgi:MFS family permease
MLPMLSTLNIVSPLLTGVAFLMIGAGGLSTIIAFRMGEADYPSIVVGLVTSLYFIGIVMGTRVCHHIISTVGHIRAFAALGSLMSAATLAHAITPDPFVWGFLRFLVGFATVGMFMCTESWLNEKSSNEIRGQVFSLYQVVLYLGQGAGQFLINVPDETGAMLYILTSILMSLAILPVALTRVAAPTLPKPVRFKIGRLWGISPTGMTTSMMAGIVMGAFYGVGALFAEQSGLDKGQTAQFMGAVIIGGLVLQYPIGKLSDIYDRRWIILAVTFGTLAICIAIIGKDASNGLGLLLLGALFGGFSFTLYPLSVAYTNDFLTAEDLVPASGGLIVAYGSGAAIGPIIASLAMDAFGARGLFSFIGWICVILATFIGYRISSRSAPVIEDAGEFQAMQRTSPIIYEIHPEAEIEEEEPILPTAEKP